MTLSRRVALEILCRSQQEHRFASDLIDECRLPPLDRRLVVQLVLGTIRARRTLDSLLRPFLTRPLETMHLQTLEILRLGIFQIAFLTQIPRHAAVHESVELAPPMVKKFVNAVLRKSCDLVTDSDAELPAADAMPVFASAGRNYRRLSRSVFPDPNRDFPAYLGSAFSLPAWLAERWAARHQRDECLRLGFWFNTPAPLWVRVNTLKTSLEEYRGLLTVRGIAHEPGEHPQALRLPDPPAVTDLPGYDRGLFCVQDESSMRVASALQPVPGSKVLDLCSAPGGKTTHLAELMGNTGRIVACDRVPERLNKVSALAQRLGIGIVQTRVVTDDELPAGPFDAALVDAPCSNTGVLGRRPEVRWRLQPEEFQHLVALQVRLLSSAVERVRRGGAVVYSTCSIEPEENAGVVQTVCQRFPGLRLKRSASAIPGQPGDGGYWARLVRDAG